ncbi:metallophosphoesterase family protein [Puniceibacterium sediminis]|uniref:Predicted phosphodiesterase n=1 Tax=Puniceibacterium sediminis TaxID=1608407 RepID=A0A238WB34_9RHOB|nr:metallophosphoesterase family protein [Puniceibacterium sediminis]SNR43795.1 Predicted phosphodiesterase [Puniceibacterium sediminis]
MIQRFAVIADVHGNADALRAVLADIDTAGLTEILNLGDHFSGPLAAAETAALIGGRDMLSIRGNHDRYLLETDPADMGSWESTAFGQLSPGDLDWLRSLPATATIGDEIFLCHATPQDDETYWMEALTPDGIPHMAALPDIAERAIGLHHSLILCGHTHTARALRLPTGQYLVNPGSVGCPAYDDTHPVPHVMQTGTSDASYAILEQRTDGWQVTFRQLPYDTRRMADLARAADRPNWAAALTTGWLSRES